MWRISKTWVSNTQDSVKQEPRDFSHERFSEDGLFGIFGNTGTGKSSVIDCITLALYGQIARYNGINSNGDFLNINRNNGEVEFVFSVRDNTGDRVYKVLRRFKRNKDKVSGGMIRLSSIDINNNEEHILENKITETNKTIEKIIGLNYKDFTKAVVLPQGKFSEFLLLDNKDKRDMLERIFSLEEYGDKLQNKINNAKKIKETSLEKLKQQVQYKSVSEEDIINNKKELQDNNNLIISLKSSIEQYNKDKKLKNDLISFKEEYSDFKYKIEELVKYEYVYLDFKERLEKAEAVDDIYSKIIQKENLDKKIKELEISVKAMEEESYNSIKELEIEREKFGGYKYKKEIDNPVLEKKVVDLENIKNILGRKIEIQEDIDASKQELVNIEGQESKQDKEFDKLVEEKGNLDSLNKELEAFNLVNNLNNDELAVRIKLEINKINNKNIDLYYDGYDDDLDNKNINLGYIKNLAINILVLHRNKVVKEAEELYIKIDVLKKENLNIDNALSDLNAQANINQNKEVIQKLASSLRDNRPCPICGSKEHPDILTPDSILGSIIEGINAEIEVNNNKLKNNEEEIRKIENKINLCNNRVKELEEGLLEEIEEVIGEGIGEGIERIGEVQGGLDDRHIYVMVMFLKLENKIKKNSVYINNNNQKINLLENNINEYNKIKNKNDLNKEVLKSRIEDRLNELDSILNRLDDKKDLQLSEVIKEVENINITIRKNIEDYSLNVELLDKIEKNSNEIGVKLVNIRAEYNANKNMLAKNKEDINELINIRDMIRGKNEEEIKGYYASRDKQIGYKNKIKSYEEKYFNYKGRLDDLEDKAVEISKISGIGDIEEIKDVRNIEDIKNSMEELNKIGIRIESNYEMALGRRGELENIIKSQEELLNQMVELNKKIKEEEEEYDVLKDLASVNKGGLFVEYLANSQLENIVKDASRRLLDMTQNKYDIKLIEGSFVIKDCLNGGSLRSIRSLSGGEIFMASLCLSLALSSKIQLNNKSPLEVFFLDEGFGTLDNNVLDTVMDSLEQLKSNNINVGIITHVEEIKSRIYNKIVISGTEDGSIIEIK